VKRNDSSARSRELGVELRKRREAARWRANDLAYQLGWSATKVSRMESGERGVSEVDAAIYLTFCGVLREELDDLLNLAREGSDETWLQEHGERLTDELRTLIFHETAAVTIAWYEPMLVPGQLQTEDYARALFEFARIVPEDRIDHAVRARMERQALLRRREPPEFQFLVHENGLRAPVGNAQIMHEQLLHLVFLNSRPQCEIRVIPAASGPHGAWFGPFMLMRYQGHGPVVYVEGLTTSVFLETRQHIDAYQNVLSRLDRAALDVARSRDLLARLASEYDRSEEEPDEHA
jgi:transcriptional regulator with XRE-family HTH domain